MPKIIDRTNYTSGIHQTTNGRNIFSHGNIRRRRNPGSISAVMLHQTDFVTHDMERMNYVICNYGIMRDGRILYLRPLDHLLNSIGSDVHAIDIEIVGRYPSFQDIRAADTGAALSVPPPQQVRAARELVRWLKVEHGLPEIYTHVHFTAKNCCGPHLWYNVGKWAVDTLHMTSPRGERSVPRSWEDAALAINL